MRRKNKEGFTLTELLVSLVVPVIIVGFGLIGGIGMGNFWVGETSALKAVKVADSSAVEVVVLERHIWGYSRVTAKDSDGKEICFYLDANILQNVRAIPAANFD